MKHFKPQQYNINLSALVLFQSIKLSLEMEPCFKWFNFAHVEKKILKYRN